MEHPVSPNDLAAEARVKHARGIEVGVGPIIEPCQRSDPVRRVDRDRGFVSELCNLGRRNDSVERPIIRVNQRQGSWNAIRTDVDDNRFGEVAVEHLAAEALDETRIVPGN
jgi:hypothetical protein